VKSLWEELVNYSGSDYYPFHMPGHKRLPEREEGALPRGIGYRGIEDIYKYDITEIEGFDNLHDAKGLLFDLQQKAARVYHAEQSFFLVNGSTGGILSAISAVAQEGKKLLVARNCHKSVYNGIALNRLQAEYLWPEMIEGFDIQGEITARQVGAHLAGRRDICAVAVTSPTYDGIISNIREIAEKVHAFHIPLIVDEAHGAHLVLSERAPKSALECGADIVINSVHKTLPALTQTALLHVQGPLIDRDRLKGYLAMYQSSSPSYLLMASIDRCIDFITEKGQEGYEKLLALRERIDAGAKEFSCIRILSAGAGRDAGKLVISVKGTGITGWELYHILLSRYHIQMEMAAPTYVLGILTAMDTCGGVERLISALKETDRKLFEKMGEKAGIKEKPGKDDIYHIVPLASGLSIYEAMQKKKEWIRPDEAAGRISGGFLYFYPPGIPLLVPGEAVSRELAHEICHIKEREGYLTGISDAGEICVLEKQRPKENKSN